MRIKLTKSKNSTSIYVIKDIVVNNKRTTKIVESLGTVAHLEKELHGADPIAWAKDYVARLNQEDKSKHQVVLRKYHPFKQLKKGHPVVYNGGYLFLQDIYYELGLHHICKTISDKYRFQYDLNEILSSLIYNRILFPSSKRKTYQQSKPFIESSSYDLHHVYRALAVLSKESDAIQAELYQNSCKAYGRNSNILYYDCTNFFFEINEEDELRTYGVSKEHRPNPIVQMGLFMDGDGIPLAMSINKGSTNEQITLKPLEEKILRDFQMSKIIVCTDAGLSSNANRKFNDIQNRAFITTQSIKTLKDHLKEWALDKEAWDFPGTTQPVNLNDLEEEKSKDIIFYKEKWINEKGLEQKLIVSYSLKYRNYQRKIRNEQIQRAIKKIGSNPKSMGKVRQNDYKRFIRKHATTQSGEVAQETTYSLNEDKIEEESKYDGFYAVCTNLEDCAEDVVKVNHQRWEIEECFRIMKTEFDARPVYLSREDCIKAHFLTCYLALVHYRYLEKRTKNLYTCREIIEPLKEMNFEKIEGEGYAPLYTRSDFTDALHEEFGFRTDYEIIKNKEMKKIIKKTKTKKSTQK